MSAEPGYGEEDAGEHGDEDAGPGGVVVEHVDETEEDRHDDGCGCRTDGSDEAPEWIAPEGYLFRERGYGQRGEVQQEE